MCRQPTERVCQVIGCSDTPAGSYLDARDSRALTFRVCPRHFEQLAAGAEPVVVDGQLDTGRVYGPALLLE